MIDKVTFPETVMLIDAAFLNDITKNFKQHFEAMLQRPLPPMDMAQFVVNLTLDTNIPAGSKEIQVVIVYDESCTKLTNSTPSDLKNELNEVAFRDQLGEFIFASLSPEKMVAREDMFFDLLRIVAESDDVKRIIVAPFEQGNRERIHTALEEIKEKDVVLFGMSEPQEERSYDWQIIAYPVMQALGIRGEEL